MAYEVKESTYGCDNVTLLTLCAAVQVGQRNSSHDGQNEIASILS